MAKKRTKTRITSKIDELPVEVKTQVDAMLTDPGTTYTNIAEWLVSMGFKVSKSSVGRYAMRSNTAAQRLLEAQSRTQALVNVVRQNPDADYTEAGLMLMMDGLINRLATAEDEFDYLPLDKVGRLIASLSRTKVYKDKVRQDMKDKADLAFKEMEEEIMKTIKSDPELKVRLKEILTRAKELMLHD